MFELRNIANGVDFLVEWDGDHHDGRLRAVVYDRPESAQEATKLAISLCVPLAVARNLPGNPGERR